LRAGSAQTFRTQRERNCSVQSRPLASSSSRRTAAVRACACASRPSARLGEPEICAWQLHLGTQRLLINRGAADPGAFHVRYGRPRRETGNSRRSIRPASSISPTTLSTPSANNGLSQVRSRWATSRHQGKQKPWLTGRGSRAAAWIRLPLQPCVSVATSRADHRPP
jgi:hypothetical protein